MLERAEQHRNARRWRERQHEHGRRPDRCGHGKHATINAYIVKCNAGELDLAIWSVGWVTPTGTANGKVAFGEDNSTERAAMAMPGNEFRIACEIEPAAHSAQTAGLAS